MQITVQRLLLERDHVRIERQNAATFAVASQDNAQGNTSRGFADRSLWRPMLANLIAITASHFPGFLQLCNY